MNIYESSRAIKRLDDSLVIVKNSIQETQNIQTAGRPGNVKMKLFFLTRLEKRLTELEALANQLYPHINVAQAYWLGDKVDMIHDFFETIHTLKEEQQHQLEKGNDQ